MLTCSCNDFDISDYDDWYEYYLVRAIPENQKCCMCNAPIPACNNEEHLAVIYYSTFEPDNAPNPDDYEDDPDEVKDSRDAWEKFVEDAEKLGFVEEHERYEREVKQEYICERCEGLMTSLSELGFCYPQVGELIEDHIEYVREYVGNKNFSWVKDSNGVWNPVKRTTSCAHEAEM